MGAILGLWSSKGQENNIKKAAESIFITMFSAAFVCRGLTTFSSLMSGATTCQRQECFVFEVYKNRLKQKSTQIFGSFGKSVYLCSVNLSD